MFKWLKLVIIMPRIILVSYFVFSNSSSTFSPKVVMQFSVISVNFMSFTQPEVEGVRLLEIKCVIFARGVRLLESVRLLERIRYACFQI